MQWGHCSIRLLGILDSIELEYKFILYIAFDLNSKFIAGILEQSMEARSRVGTGLSSRPSRLHSLRVCSLESIPGLLKSLQIPFQGYTGRGDRFLSSLKVKITPQSLPLQYCTVYSKD
jgi:hypothetical protein